MFQFTKFGRLYFHYFTAFCKSLLDHLIIMLGFLLTQQFSSSIFYFEGKTQRSCFSRRPSHTLSNDIRPLSNRGKCHFRGSRFQNFPGGPYPRTPLINRVPPCIATHGGTNIFSWLRHWPPM